MKKNEVNINEPKTSIYKLIYNYSKVTIQPERKHTLWGETWTQGREYR